MPLYCLRLQNNSYDFACLRLFAYDFSITATSTLLSPRAYARCRRYAYDASHDFMLISLDAFSPRRHALLLRHAV